MERINKIDSDITSYIEEFRLEAKKLRFEIICEFKLDQTHIPEIPWKTFQCPGIYWLEIKNNEKFKDINSWMNHFKSKWEDESYLKCFTPNLKLKRIKEHKALGAWIPI
jgi:hypothetical protein